MQIRKCRLAGKCSHNAGPAGVTKFVRAARLRRPGWTIAGIASSNRTNRRLDDFHLADGCLKHSAFPPSGKRRRRAGSGERCRGAVSVLFADPLLRDRRIRASCGGGCAVWSSPEILPRRAAEAAGESAGISAFPFPDPRRNRGHPEEISSAGDSSAARRRSGGNPSSRHKTSPSRRPPATPSRPHPGPTASEAFAEALCHVHCAPRPERIVLGRRRLSADDERCGLGPIGNWCPKFFEPR